MMKSSLFLFTCFLWISCFPPVQAQTKKSYIDQNGQLYIDGEAFLPFGIYCEGIYEEADFLSIPDTIATTDMNILELEVNATSETVFDQFFDKCEAYDIKTVMLMFPYDLFPTAFDDWGNRQKSEPSVAFWDILDDSNNYTLADLTYQRQRMLAIDTTRVVSQSMYALGLVEDFVPLTEVAAIQGYPWGNGGDDLSSTYFTFSRFCDTTRMIGHFPITNNQTFNWDDETYPPTAHLDCQTYLSFVCGAKGVINYTFLDYDNGVPFNITQPNLWNQLKQNATEVLKSELKNVFLFGEHQRTEIAPYRYYATWRYQGQLYIIVLNAKKNRSYNYQIPLPVGASGPAQNVFDYRPNSLSVQNNNLTGQLAPYQVAIYRFADRPSTCLPIRTITGQIPATTYRAANIVEVKGETLTDQITFEAGDRVVWSAGFYAQPTSANDIVTARISSCSVVEPVTTNSTVQEDLEEAVAAEVTRVEAYPNPTTDEVMVEYTPEVSAEAHLILVNEDGTVVWQRKQQLEANIPQQQLIPTGQLLAGIYTLHITIGGEVATTRFVVAR